jgi:hypothetical protein
MSGFGDKPFGIRDIKLTNIAGSTQVDLPVAQKMACKERLVSAELHGDDTLKSVQSSTDALEWELEAGGIPLEAYALMTGRTVVAAGTQPNQTVTLTAQSGDVMPWFKIYGKAVDGTGDVHVKIFKAKLNAPIEGEFADSAFYVTKCAGLAIDDDVNGLYEWVQNETAADLPSS